MATENGRGLRHRNHPASVYTIRGLCWRCLKQDAGPLLWGETGQMICFECRVRELRERDATREQAARRQLADAGANGKGVSGGQE